MPAVYTAAHLSLAALELLVHVSDVEDLPPDLVAISAALPDDVSIEYVRVEELPTALADHGTAWLTAMRAAVLAVPSAVIPAETNYILNPAHRDFARIVVSRPEPFALDPRLNRAVSRRPVR